MYLLKRLESNIGQDRTPKPNPSKKAIGTNARSLASKFLSTSFPDEDEKKAWASKSELRNEMLDSHSAKTHACVGFLRKGKNNHEFIQ